MGLAGFAPVDFNEKWNQSYQLTLDVPVFALIIRVLRREIYITHLQHHLQTSIPELLPEIHEHRLPETAIGIQEILISSLFRWPEVLRVAFYEWIAPKFDEVYPLIKVPWRLQIEDCAIEQWNECIDETFHNTVQEGIA